MKRIIRSLADRLLGPVEEKEAPLCFIGDSDSGLVCCGLGWHLDRSSKCLTMSLLFWKWESWFGYGASQFQSDRELIISSFPLTAALGKNLLRTLYKRT